MQISSVQNLKFPLNLSQGQDDQNEPKYEEETVQSSEMEDGSFILNSSQIRKQSA